MAKGLMHVKLLDLAYFELESQIVPARTGASSARMTMRKRRCIKGKGKQRMRKEDLEEDDAVVWPRGKYPFSEGTYARR